MSLANNSNSVQGFWVLVDLFKGNVIFLIDFLGTYRDGRTKDPAQYGNSLSCKTTRIFGNFFIGEKLERISLPFLTNSSYIRGTEKLLVPLLVPVASPKFNYFLDVT